MPSQKTSTTWILKPNLAGNLELCSLRPDPPGPPPTSGLVELLLVNQLNLWALLTIYQVNEACWITPTTQLVVQSYYLSTSCYQVGDFTSDLPCDEIDPDWKVVVVNMTLHILENQVSESVSVFGFNMILDFRRHLRNFSLTKN